ERLVVFVDFDGAMSEEAYRMPIACFAQHRVRGRDLAHSGNTLLWLADAPTVEQRTGLDGSSRAECREHGAASRDVFLDALCLNVSERADIGDDHQGVAGQCSGADRLRRALFDTQR